MLKRFFFKAFATVAYLSLFALNAAYAELPNALQAGDEKLTLNGSGSRTKYLMEMYVAGLYLEQPSSDPAAIVGRADGLGDGAGCEGRHGLERDEACDARDGRRRGGAAVRQRR